MQGNLFSDPQFISEKDLSEMEMHELASEIKLLEGTATGRVKPRPFRDPSNKWLTRSALQKACRRGQTDIALKCTDYLLEDDVTYFWYSMATIAIEDIGPMNPDLVFFCTALASHAMLRKLVDTNKAAEALVVIACETNKTRACCELDIAANRTGYPLMLEMYNWSDDDLIGVLDPSKFEADAGDLTNLYRIYWALTLLRGRAPLPANTIQRRGKSEAGVQRVLEMFLEVMPEPHARAAMMAYEKGKDSMNFAYYPVWLAMESNGYGLMDDVMGPEILIKGLPGCALDMHTSKGKQVMKAMYTSLKKTYPEIGKIKPEDAVRGIGAAVFVEEGGLEVKRAWNPIFKSIKDAQDKALMISYGVPEEVYQPVREIIRKELTRLNDKRAWAMENLQ